MYEYMKEIDKYVIDMLKVNGIKSNAFYVGRIESFFNVYIETECKNKPLNAINYYDVNSYLESLKCAESEKVNIYSALKRFFDYTYTKGLTREIISQVVKPEYIKKPKEVLTDEEYKKLKNYIICKENKGELKNRLILGLFLFTGLSRKYIANLKNCDFRFREGLYKLEVWKDDVSVELPVKAELQLVISDYLSIVPDSEMLDKVIKIDSNWISGSIKEQCKKIGVSECSPTKLSNTFISKALCMGNHLFEVSELTLESVSTIEQHISNRENLYNIQMSILNSF